MKTKSSAKVDSIEDMMPFDAPNMPVRARRDVTNSSGEPPLVGTNEAARDAAIKAVIEFLTNHR